MDGREREQELTQAISEIREWLVEINADYNAKEIYESINNAQSNETSEHTVLIGDVIIDARSIESVQKLDAK